MPSLDPFEILSEANAPQDAHDSQDSEDSQDSQDSQDSRDFHRQTENLTGNLNRDQPSDFATISAMPLQEYVRAALEFAEQSKGDLEDDGVWNSPLFPFARFCKAHPAIVGFPSDEAMRAVEEAMLAWDDLPEDTDPWEYFFPDADDADSARLDFMTSWSAVRHIPFLDVLRNALRLADERPLTPARKRGKLYERFVSLAGWLQVLMNGSAIYLPTRKLDTLLECDHRTISSLRKLAIEDGLLTVVKHHTFRPNGKGEATEFQFAVERFERLRGEQ